MRRSDIWMVIFFAVSAALVVLAHENPFARTALCDVILACPRLDQGGFWKKLTYDVGMGSLMSIVFYALLVRVPEERKRRRLKASLTNHYRMFKEDSISLFVGAADGSYRPEHVKSLMDQSAFRTYFKEDVDGGGDRWGRAITNLNDHTLQELIVGMEVFRDEITYVLDNGDIALDKAFEFLKSLSFSLHFARSTAALDYDSAKQLARFYWRILSGWDWVTGYPEEDVVEAMIKTL